MIQQLIRKIELNASALEITLYPKATEHEIVAFDKRLSTAISEDMKSLDSLMILSRRKTCYDPGLY